MTKLEAYDMKGMSKEERAVYLGARRGALLAGKTLLTRDEAMERYNLGDVTLRAWTGEGLEQHRKGSKVYYKSEDIERFIEQWVNT